MWFVLALLDRLILVYATPTVLPVEKLDFCVMGDSTLNMFTTPIWDRLCLSSPKSECGFSVIESGMYFLQLHKGNQYPHRSYVGVSNDKACRFLFIDYHDFAMLSKAEKFWLDRGKRYSCGRLLTNYHHHAGNFLGRRRTLESVISFAKEMQERINASFSFKNFVHLLPTFPMLEHTNFTQTREEVLETSVVLATMVETMAVLQDLSELWRLSGRFHDNLHINNSLVLKDNFTAVTIQRMLAREFALCRQQK